MSQMKDLTNSLSVRLSQ